MGNVLLIWEEIPDNTKLFIVVDEHMKEVAKKCHNKLVNEDDEPALEELNEALDRDDLDPTKFISLNGERSEVESAIDVSEYNITHVVISGFML